MTIRTCGGYRRFLSPTPYTLSPPAQRIAARFSTILPHEILREEWQVAMERHGWAIGSYVVMPDHVHFFCKPTHDAIKLSELMQHWKQWTSKRIKKEFHLKDPVWQDGFFDHLLRSYESYSEKWNYVEQNPVRAGLVEHAGNWPYSGFTHYK
jgi:putative transposase